ncbi:glycosyl hydrolase [Prevotella sp.]|uniref:glycosyl hydrolase n=1 Tax=Prevotella sp. TaxID=59823 RepID=UPI0026473911|nr:glycosyl hydrolase [Prevotella sp.]MDN5554423.1 DNA-binding protein [Prevotella sp.]
MKRLVYTILISFLVAVSVYGDSRPWTFWYWMYGAVSKAGIHEDLKGMKDIGLGGCYLMPIRGVADKPEFNGDATQLSPKFWQMVDYSFSQADSLGLDMGIHICDGFALAGAPCISPAESMQKVVWSDTVISVKPSSPDNIKLVRPEAYMDYYEDIAAFALPVKYDTTKVKPIVLSHSDDLVVNPNGSFNASKSCWIEYNLGRKVTLRSIDIIPSGNNIQCQRVKVMVSDDGNEFKLASQLQPARQGWQSTGYGFTYAISPVSAKFVRLEWSPDGTEPGSEDLDAAKWKPNFKLKSVNFGLSPVISQWRGKAGFTWLVAPETTKDEVPDGDCIKKSDIIRLKLNNGRVVGKLPNGTWRILRMGHTSTRQMNATAGGGKGLEVDKFSSSAVNKLLDNWYSLFLSRSHSSVVKYLHVDSWECGTQNWGYQFAKEFKSRRGYNLIDWLPVMAGIPLESAAQSERVLRDIRSTQNDLVNEIFFKTVEKYAHQHGRKISHESIAPTFVADGLEHYKYSDVPMGEFWLNSPTHDKPSDMLDAISGAHIYGKPIVQAEGFTEVRGVWNETPAMIKPLLDHNFALGMNKLFFHVNTHNPWTDKKPGMTLDGIGLFFQRDNTWYHESGALVDYINRCQKMLQSGTPVVDIAVFTGEEMPSRSFTPDRLVNILPGLFGNERVESERRRLENKNQPFEESPVGVVHASGIMNLNDWINPLHGYHYDSMNSDALLNAKIVDGRIVMPGGISYGILVMPGKTKMTPSFSGYSKVIADRIKKLRKSGVTVIDVPYTDDTFKSAGIPRDIVVPNGIAFNHVKTKTGDDIYFLSNQFARIMTFKAIMRQADIKGCMLYDAQKDIYFSPSSCSMDNGFANVEITLPSHGSVFVIFPHHVLSTTLSKLPVYDKVVNVSGDWQVTFDATGINVKTNLPNDWSISDNAKIRYYSGSAEYSTHLRCDILKGQNATLSLGKVCDIAHVFVNDVDCGVAWTSPYEVDVTKALRKGDNFIKIIVTNTWANALRGNDIGNPPFSGIWTNAPYRMKDDKLLNAGLIGPVELKY